MDDYLMELNKPSKYVNFGPEPIFSYIIAKKQKLKYLELLWFQKLTSFLQRI